MNVNQREIVYLVLQCTVLVFSIVGLSCLVKAYTLQHYFYTDGDGNVIDILPWFAFILSIIWTSISIPLIHRHKRRTRFNADAAAEPNAADNITLPCPPVFVVLDFHAMGLAVSMGGILLVWCISNVGSQVNDYIMWYLATCRSTEWESDFSSEDQCRKTAYLVYGLEWTAAMLCMINGFIHFALFVHACRQCERWRKARIARKKGVQHGQDWIELNETVNPKL